jgi:uncharacterized membrane protein YdjX (TVP38/TMEM64 family)
MRKRTKLFIGFLVFLFALIGIFILLKSSNLENLENLNYLKKIIDYGEELSPLKFILIYVLATILFIPSYILSFNSAILFGFYHGIIYSIIGIFISSILVFSFARIFAKPFIENALKEKYNKLYELDNFTEKNGFLSVLFLRILPIPFILVNIITGFTKVKFKDYILATMLWMIPEVILIVYLRGIFSEFKMLKLIIFVFIFYDNNVFFGKRKNKILQTFLSV